MLQENMFYKISILSNTIMSKTSNLWACRTKLYRSKLKSNTSNVFRIASDVFKRFVRQNFGFVKQICVEQNYEVEQIQRFPNCIRCFPEVRSTCSRTTERTDGTVNKSEQIRFTEQEKCRKFKCLK